MALLSGPLRMLAAVRALDLTSRDATTDLIAVSRYGGVDLACSDFNQRARLVTLRRLRRRHPTVSDADAAQYLSGLYGQNNPMLQSRHRLPAPLLALIHAYRIAAFAVRY